MMLLKWNSTGSKLRGVMMAVNVLLGKYLDFPNRAE